MTWEQDTEAAIKIVKFVIDSTLALLWASPVYAEEGTIQELRDKCKTAELLLNHKKSIDIERDVPRAFYCLGFRAGMGFGLQLNCADGTTRPVAIVKGTTGKRVRAFLNWVDTRSETWGRSEACAARALAESLPCDRVKAS